MDKDGIMVAKYWTTMPPKAEFQKKIQDILAETRERLEQRKLLLPVEVDETNGSGVKQDVPIKYSGLVRIVIS